MSVAPNPIRANKAYWDSAAETYQQDFTDTLVGQLWREAVWRDLDAGFQPGQRVLELNCGTGIDAAHLAARGVSVLGCDISPRMIEIAAKRTFKSGLSGLLSFRTLATEDIGAIDGQEMFDGAFSNFSGLNCVEDLSAVKQNLARLLKPQSTLFLCVLGRFALWEKIWYLAHGDLTKAIRTLRSSGSPAPGIIVRYPSRKTIVSLLAPEFTLRRFKAIGVTVPPSYMESWARRFALITRGLDRVDRVVSGLPLFRSMGACILLEFERTKRQ